MSFGLDIVTLDQDGNEHWIEVVDGHTYNLSPMWRKALPRLLAEGSTSALEGLRCRDILQDLEAGLLDAVRKADEYIELNPVNGWGDYDGFFEVFAKFVRLAWTYPSGIVRWNG